MRILLATKQGQQKFCSEVALELGDWVTSHLVTLHFLNDNVEFYLRTFSCNWLHFFPLSRVTQAPLDPQAYLEQ